MTRSREGLGVVALSVFLALQTTPGLAPELGDGAGPNSHMSVDSTTDIALTIQDFDDTEDPDEWLVDSSSGLHYRRTTDQERQANGWPNGTILVEQGSGTLDGFSTGSAGVEFLIALNDTETRHLNLSNSRANHRVNLTEHYIEGVENVVEPTRTKQVSLYTYRQADNSTSTYAIADNETGLFARSAVNRSNHNDTLMVISGPESAWTIEDLPTEDGDSVNEGLVILETLYRPVGTYSEMCVKVQMAQDSWLNECGEQEDPNNGNGNDAECGDGKDNDGDDWVDHPDDPGCDSKDDNDEWDPTKSYLFGVFGEVKWCTWHSDTWETRTAYVARIIDLGFRNRQTKANLVVEQRDCWFADSMGTANQCDSGEITCSHNHFHLGDHYYSYNGCNGDASCYSDEVWDDSDHSHKHDDYAGLKIAQAIHNGTMSHDGGTVCGLANVDLIGGDSVAAGPDSTARCYDFVSPHEVGHNFAADHGKEDKTGNSCGSGGTEYTLMFTGGSADDCRANHFSDSNRRQINECAFDTEGCPRAGTG